MRSICKAIKIDKKPEALNFGAFVFERLKRFLRFANALVLACGSWRSRFALGYEMTRKRELDCFVASRSAKDVEELHKTGGEASETDSW